jgi:hypothetical protein
VGCARAGHSAAPQLGKPVFKANVKSESATNGVQVSCLDYEPPPGWLLTAHPAQPSSVSLSIGQFSSLVQSCFKIPETRWATSALQCWDVILSPTALLHQGPDYDKTVLPSHNQRTWCYPQRSAEMPTKDGWNQAFQPISLPTARLIFVTFS